MKKTADDLIQFPALGGGEATAHVRVFVGDGDEKPVVIVGQLDDNNSTSVTNAIEEIHVIVEHRYFEGLIDFDLIEFYPGQINEVRGPRTAFYSLVEIVGGRASWSHVKTPDLERRLGLLPEWTEQGTYTQTSALGRGVVVTSTSTRIKYDLICDEVLNFERHGQLCAAHVRVFEAERELPVVIAGQLDDNAGTSVTNAIEEIAAIAADRYFDGATDFELFEFYPAPLGPTQPARRGAYDEVKFATKLPPATPSWEPMPSRSLEWKLGRMLPEWTAADSYLRSTAVGRT